MLAANSNKLASSDLSISDTADNIESAAQESFLSTVGSVHATGATIAQAGEFIDTGYVNSITLKTSAFQDLRVREAEIVTNDKIVSTVSSYEIKDSLANITVASPSLLANSNGYEVATDISGVLDIDEALAWKVQPLMPLISIHPLNSLLRTLRTKSSLLQAIQKLGLSWVMQPRSKLSAGLYR